MVMLEVFHVSQRVYTNQSTDDSNNEYHDHREAVYVHVADYFNVMSLSKFKPYQKRSLNNGKN